MNTYQDVLFYSTLKIVVGLAGFSLAITVGMLGRRLASSMLSLFGLNK